MSPAKKASGGGRKSTAKKTSTRAKKTASRKTASKRPSKKTIKKSTARKPVARRSVPKKTAAKKTSAKKSPAKKKTSAKKAPAKKVAAAKTAAKKTVAATPFKRTGKKASPEVAPKKILPPSRPFVVPTQVAPPKRRVRPAKFDAAQLKKLRENLETKRGELEGRMAELEESFDATQSDITGEVGLDEDFADAGTATFERERDLSIRNNIRDLIDQMNRAIQRIDDGSYGTCERCGQSIDAARLRELPHASLCLDCKRREERAR